MSENTVEEKNNSFRGNVTNIRLHISYQIVVLMHCIFEIKFIQLKCAQLALVFFFFSLNIEYILYFFNFTFLDCINCLNSVIFGSGIFIFFRIITELFFC